MTVHCAQLFDSDYNQFACADSQLFALSVAITKLGGSRNWLALKQLILVGLELEAVIQASC